MAAGELPARTAVFFRHLGKGAGYVQRDMFILCFGIHRPKKGILRFRKQYGTLAKCAHWMLKMATA